MKKKGRRSEKRLRNENRRNCSVKKVSQWTPLREKKMVFLKLKVKKKVEREKG